MTRERSPLPFTVNDVSRPLEAWIRLILLLPSYAYVVRRLNGSWTTERSPLDRINVQTLPAGLATVLKIPIVSYRSWVRPGRVSVKVPLAFCVRALDIPAGGRYLPLPSLPVYVIAVPPP